MKRFILLVTPLAMLAAEPAIACSYVQVPEEVGDTSAQFFARAMVAAAAYVDLVLVEDDGTRALGERPTGILTLRSVARLKGNGPDRFSLFGHGLTLQPEAERVFGARPMHFTSEDGRVVPFPYNEERQAQLFGGNGAPPATQPPVTSCNPPTIAGETGRFYVVMRGADGRLLGDFALYEGVMASAFAFVPVTLDGNDHWLRAVRLATFSAASTSERTVLHLPAVADPPRIDAALRKARVTPVAAFVGSGNWLDEVRPADAEAGSPWLARVMPLIGQRNRGGIGVPDHGAAEFLRRNIGVEQTHGGLGYEVAQAFLASIRRKQMAAHTTPRLIAIEVTGPAEEIAGLSSNSLFSGMRPLPANGIGLPSLSGDTEIEQFAARQAIERNLWLLNGGNGNPQGTLP